MNILKKLILGGAILAVLVLLAYGSILRDKFLSTPQPELEDPLRTSEPTPVNESKATQQPQSDSDATGISPEEAVQLLPLQPSQISVEALTGAIVLKWRGTGEDVIQYEVSRKEIDGDWVMLGTVEAMGDNRGWYEYRDTSPDSGTTYIYGIQAVNLYRKKSPISESPVISAK